METSGHNGMTGDSCRYYSRLRNAEEKNGNLEWEFRVC